MRERRKLAAIMFTDIVGYTSAMAESERHAMAQLQHSRKLVKSHCRRYAGRWLQTIGDGNLIEFDSVVAAIDCALDIQRSLADGDTLMRIGIHIGDVIHEGNNLYGDGVNVASRIEALASPGGVVVSEIVYDSVRNKAGIQAEFLGAQSLKGLDHPIRVYALQGSRDRVGKLDLLDAPAAGHRRWLVQALAALALLAAAGALIVALWNPVAQTVPGSVAVLPFDSIGPESGTDYIGAGLAEELISNLSRIGDLRVASRSATFSLHDGNLSAQQIGRRLGVETVLEGSIRRSNNNLRIGVQLVGVTDGLQRWSHTYDRPMEDILKVQKQIARAVTDQLQVVLTEEGSSLLDRALTSDVNAYDYYLQGRNYLRQPGSEASIENAEKLLRSALELDPDFVRARIGLCDAQMARYVLLQTPDLVRETLETCETVAQQNPHLAEAHASLGELYFHTGDFDSSAVELHEALRINPRMPETLEVLGNTLYQLQQPDAAEAAFQRRIELEPGFWRGHYALGRFLYVNGRFDESVQAFGKAVELSPDNAPAYNGLGAAEYMRANFGAAADAWAHSLALAPNRSAYVNTANAYYYGQEFEKSVQYYQKALELAPDDFRVWGGLAEAATHLPGASELAREAYETAARLSRELLELNPAHATAAKNLALYAARLGHRDEAEMWLETVANAQPREKDVPLFVARTRVALGDTELAFEAIEMALDEGFTNELVAAEPDFAELRQSDRYKEMWRRLNTK